ncbi:MAG: uridine kinase [Verrucomicrobiae bacterium]
MKAPVHVAVVGGSGSGKTWLAEKLAATLAPRAARLSLDDFYRDLSPLPLAERDAVNFDDPAAIDWEKFRAVIGAMRVGEKINLPVYDFATHTRKVAARNFIPPPLLIWDGLWLLHHDWLRAQFALTFFVECGAEERFRRRTERDMRERGRSFESVRVQFFEHVQPMHERFVEPQRQWAAQIVDSPVSEKTLDGLVENLLQLNT